MNSLAWMTFSVTLALGAWQIQGPTVDQPARNISSLQAEAVEESLNSTSAVEAKKLDGFKSLGQALKRQNF
jgi:hypothetical protein